MESCAHREMESSKWQALSRLRDVSRLVLVALEHEDYREAEKLSRESASLLHFLQNEASVDAPRSAEFTSALSELARANRQIVAGLFTKRDATKQELADVRAHRSRVRPVKLPGHQTGTRVDRES